MNGKLLIVLQTHSLGDSQHYANITTETRFVNVPKGEVQRRCVHSLVDSLNYAKPLLPFLDIELVVLDDHSSEEAVTELKTILNIATFETKFIALETYGIMPSILQCYEYGKKHGKDIVYFAQDDYLYELNAIYDMVFTMLDTSENLQNYTSIYPYNDPFRYSPENTSVVSHIIRSCKRHWRTQIMTASCFMTHHKIIVDNWDLFEAMGKSKISASMEDDTINQLFRTKGYYLFVPIPSLAFHMQYSAEMDDLADWATLWKKYERAEKLSPTTDNTVLNIGFGGGSIQEHLFSDDLKGYREITLDINPRLNPDICADLNNISHIPNNYVNCVYGSHVIEHLHFYKVVPTIKELLRITKPGGFVRIIVPDVQQVGDHVKSGKLLTLMYESPGGPVAAMDMLYGSSIHTHRSSEDYMFHKCGFTTDVLEKLASDNNLSARIVVDGFNIIADFIKA